MTGISAKGLYKVFGKNPSAGVQKLEQGETRAKLMEEGLTAAVIDASFDVEPGEIFVVMGLSGSGKSTLIRMVNGLLPATAGELTIDGTPLTKMSEKEIREVRRDKISMVFQNFALLPHRTVAENAAYGLEIKGMGRDERMRKAEEALAMVGLDGWGDYSPSELSGGMQQRVGLARALAADTDVLLMDEAFSALDPLIRKDMQDQLIELQRKLNKTILFITHDLNEAMRLGDHIAMMRDGRIEQIGTAEDILQNPANNYVANFVKDVDRSRVLVARNIVEPTRDELRAEDGPLTAQKFLRESNSPWLIVLNRDRTPAGVVFEEDVARAVRDGVQSLPIDKENFAIVHEEDTIADLFGKSAENRAPLVVVNDDGHYVGIVPRVTLLASAASEPTATSEPTTASASNRESEPTPEDAGQTTTVAAPTAEGTAQPITKGDS